MHPFKLFIEFAASFGKFMDQLSDMTDYPVRLLKGIAAIGLVIAIVTDCLFNGGEHSNVSYCFGSIVKMNGKTCIIKV